MEEDCMASSSTARGTGSLSRESAVVEQHPANRGTGYKDDRVASSSPSGVAEQRPNPTTGRAGLGGYTVEHEVVRVSVTCDRATSCAGLGESSRT